MLYRGSVRKVSESAVIRGEGINDRREMSRNVPTIISSATDTLNDDIRQKMC